MICPKLRYTNDKRQDARVGILSLSQTLLQQKAFVSFCFLCFSNRLNSFGRFCCWLSCFSRFGNCFGRLSFLSSFRTAFSDRSFFGWLSNFGCFCRGSASKFSQLLFQLGIRTSQS